MFDDPAQREDAGFVPGTLKAAISVPSNIAEGNGKRNNKDYGRFVEIALGSAFELETRLIIMQDLKLGDPDKVNELLELVIEEQKLLYGLLRKLNYE